VVGPFSSSVQLQQQQPSNIGLEFCPNCWGAITVIAPYDVLCASHASCCLSPFNSRLLIKFQTDVLGRSVGCSIYDTVTFFFLPFSLTPKLLCLFSVSILHFFFFFFLLLCQSIRQCSPPPPLPSFPDVVRISRGHVLMLPATFRHRLRQRRPRWQSGCCCCCCCYCKEWITGSVAVHAQKWEQANERASEAAHSFDPWCCGCCYCMMIHYTKGLRIHF
jgi:hypothetical protein